MKKILTLVIDGLGINENEEGNALLQASMKNYKKMLEFPHCTLEASGESIGMVKGQPGNPEVSYKTMASGKTFKQKSSFIKEFVDRDSLATNPTLKSAIEQVRKKKSCIHVIGMMSDAGIISNIEDTVKIVEYLQDQDVKVFVDFIADGHDVDGKTALSYVERILSTGVKIVTICGRYYAMDKGELWDRTKIYYDLVRNGVGLRVKEIPLALKNCYMRSITDEFLPPIIVEEGHQLQNNDVIIWTNYDGASSKQFLMALTDPNAIDEFETVAVENLKVLSMYPIEGVETTALVSIENDDANSLGKYFGKLDITQARVALDSGFKYVTYYFNGEDEEKIPKCSEYLVEVPDIETDKPKQLALAALTKQIIKCMDRDTEFILASIDMADKVAHTGNIEETIHILEFIDECLGRIMESASLNFYTVIVTSSHGNVEEMIKEGKTTVTDTTAKVPFIMSDERLRLTDGNLADIAPTILSYMDISIPASMNGKVLIKE